jgi:hypothetical protein
MSLRPTAIVPVLMLLLCSAACRQENEPAKAYFLDLATAPEWCGDGRALIATAIGSHRAKLDTKPAIAIAEIGPRLRVLLQYRSEKIVYVTAELGVSWGEFIDLLDHIRPEVEMMSMVTPQVDALFRRRLCLGFSCGDCVRLRRLHGN